MPALVGILARNPSNLSELKRLAIACDVVEFADPLGRRSGDPLHDDDVEEDLRHRAEIDWLRAHGLVRDKPADWLNPRSRKPTDAISKELWESAVKAFSLVPGGVAMLFARLRAIQVHAGGGEEAFVIPPDTYTERSFARVDGFPSGSVISVAINSFPEPDDRTPWDEILSFRNDAEAQRRRLAFRLWARKLARGDVNPAEITDEIDHLLGEYEHHMRVHRLKINKGSCETLLTVAAEVAEDLVKIKWGKLAKLPFLLRERKIALMEAELKAPGRELAYISMARERFRPRD